jgi:hypothetical protein
MRETKYTPQEMTPNQTRLTDTTLPKKKSGYDDFMKFRREQIANDNKENHDHQAGITKQDGDKKGEPLKDVINTQINNGVIQANQVEPITRYNPNSAGEQSLILAQEKVTMFFQQMQLEQRLTATTRTESQFVALQAAKEQIAKAQSAITEQMETQSLSKNLAQDENLRPSNETPQEDATNKPRGTKRKAFEDPTTKGKNDAMSTNDTKRQRTEQPNYGHQQMLETATDQNRGIKRKAFEDLTNTQNNDSVRQANNAKRRRTEDYDLPKLKEDAKEEVQAILAKQAKQAKQEVIPIQMGTPTNPMDQLLPTKQADSDDSKAKSTKDKDIVDPDKDEFSNTPNLDYQYLNNTTSVAAQLSDSTRKVRT